MKILIHYIIDLAAFAGILFFNIPFPMIIVGAIIADTIFTFMIPQKNSNLSQEEFSDYLYESEYVINSGTKIEHTGYSSARLIRQVITFVTLWFLPLAMFGVLSTDFSFWKNLTFFFTKAALVPFG